MTPCPHCTHGYYGADICPVCKGREQLTFRERLKLWSRRQMAKRCSRAERERIERELVTGKSK